MNKKSIIVTILGIIILVLLTMFITINAESYEIGETVTLGYAYPDVEMKDSSGNVVANIMNPLNFDYFCAKRGATFLSLDSYATFYTVAKVEITGDTAKVTAEKQNNNELYTETYEETETNANKAMALLFYKIKSGEVELDELAIDIKYGKTTVNNEERWYAYQVSSVKTGNRVVLTRKRTNAYGYPGFPYDFGQSAMWRAIQYWQNNVAVNMDTNNQSMWSKVASYIQSTDLENMDTNQHYDNITEETTAYEYGKELYSEVIDEVSQTETKIENEYGIEETYYNNSSSDKEVETRIDEESTTILGPFQYNFVGTIENGRPTLTFNEDTTPQEYTIGTYEGSEFVETDTIVSGNKFYIKISTDLLASASSIHLNFQIEGISLDKTNTTIYFLLQKDSGQYQPMIYIEQEEGYNEPFVDSYRISEPVEVSIEKKDEDGNALKAEGIKFQIKDETNAVVAYITTDANGNGIITDSNGEATGETKVTLLKGQTYTLIENENNIYGYKKGYLSVGNIEIAGAQIEQSEEDIKFVLNSDCEDEVIIKAKNQKELANVEIEKSGEDSTKLENVEFVIRRDDNKYLQLTNIMGNRVKDSKGRTTINSNNVATLTENHAEYVDDINAATIFKTDANGKIVINNLEVNKSKTKKYSYTAYEIYNPNYGYGSVANTLLRGTATELVLNQTTKIEITNRIDLGNLNLEKYDEDKTNLKLENVGFAIEISPAPENEHAYLALYDKDGNIVPNKKGTTTINRQNIANDGEYKVSYYYTDTDVMKMTDEEKANITTFITESDGTLTVNNLEVYSPNTGDNYTYKLIETSNDNYGFIANGQKLETELESNLTVNKKLGNSQVYTKISGYVWIENKSGKSDNYDGLYEGYTEENQSKDILLTDIYLTDEEENVTGLNPTPDNLKAPVEIKLYDIENETFIKAQPDEFSSDGKYTFTNVLIEKLENYQVVFVYDGFYYTTIIEQIEEDNGSKVKEVSSERTTLNSVFGTVKYDNEVISTTGEKNTVTYTKDEDPTIVGHESTVSKLNFDSTISANTGETGYSLYETYNKMKTSVSETLDGIDNVNMGIVLRKQPKLKIDSDIYSVSVDVNDRGYTYYYNGRQQHYNNLNDDEVGVKFEQETSINRYDIAIYSSDVQAYNNGTVTDMGVSIIYKMPITNQSETLTSVVHEITNYFDNDYTIEAIGLSLNNNQIGNLLDSSIWSDENITKNVNVEYADGVTADEGKSYNSVRILLSENGAEGLTLEAGKSKCIYIKYSVSKKAIRGLLTRKSTYHNATEIMSYSTYYGRLTGTQTVDNQAEYIVSDSEQGRTGKIYAGIDKSSEPGNIQLKLIKDPRDTEEGLTPILDTSNYEDDTTSAPALLLEPTSTRKISGTIFEDKATEESLEKNEKLGDGIYDSSNEKTIDGVIVALYEADENGNIKTEVDEDGNTVYKIAKYSDKSDAIATTDGEGNYTFGDDDVGIVPGNYIIQFTYNNESYIVGTEVDEEGNKINKNLNVNDYKSTIITSEVIKSAINSVDVIEYGETTYPTQKWYLIQEAKRYSDAIDDISLRNTLESDVVKYSTYQNSSETTCVMNARTAPINIGLEFTIGNEIQIDTTSLETMRNRVEELKNIDFGIIERPDASMEISKQITGLEITAQTGTNIIPQGDPSNPNASMQYVKTGLDGLVSAEIESKLLQDAKLKLEYSITVTNKCQKDYKETEYYLYGTGGETVKTLKVEKVVDYLETTMTLDSEKNSEEIWTEITAKELYEQGLISDEVYETLKTGDYYILITEQFSELVEPESSKTIKLYATKYLSTSDNIDEENHVEIIELSGGRTIKESIPGNYDPAISSPNEPDDDKVVLQAISPQGTTVNYELYVIAIIVTFMVLVSGIVIIKKKIIK